MSDALDDMLAHDIIEPAPANTPPTGSMYLRPVSANKTVLIFNLREHSLRQRHDPTRFSLPTPDDLQPHILSNPNARMTRIDLTRCYDSLILPRSAPRFAFAFNGRMFVYKRLPFGWDRAPVIAQRLTTSIVRTAVDSIRTSGRISVLVYLDDVVVLGDLGPEVREVTAAIVEHMTAAGLITNLAKSILEPTSSLTALGRDIDVPAATISPTAASRSAAIRAALDLASRPTSRRTKLAVAGLILWTSRRALPRLQRLYAAAHAPNHRPWVSDRVARDVLAAAAFAARDAWRADRWAITDRPLQLPTSSPTTAVYFVDASAERGLAAMATPSGETRTWRIPRIITRHHQSPAHAQQDAELFGVSKAARLALARREPAIIVPDSTSALYATARLSSGARAVLRAQLLARVAGARARRPAHDITFAWSPTETHPADPLTYPSPDMAEVTRRLASVRRVLPPPPADPSYGLDHRYRSEPPAFGGLIEC